MRRMKELRARINETLLRLYRNGNSAAAGLIETLRGTEPELQFMLDYADDGDFDDELEMNQLRSMWTAFCIHHDIEVDTYSYDNWLLRLWGVIGKKPGVAWTDFEDFDEFMCAYLV